MIKYMLCLDESGNFDKDLQKLSKNPCLSGGILYKEGSFGEAKAAGILERCREQSGLGSINHATELASQSKGLLTCRVLKDIKKYPVEFVIFEDDIRLQVIDSTITYLTVVTEGIIQLLKLLTFQNAGAVELNVLVGYRKDTSGEVAGGYIDGYIPLADYKRRLDEKLKIEKAKTGNSWISSSRVNLALGDDKRVSRLVLCDYVCNFWFTRTASAFNVSDGKQPVRVTLLSLYDKNYVFPLFTQAEDDHVHRMVTDGTYADALFESLCGLLSEKNSQIVQRIFSKLPEAMIERHLDSLSGYIQDIIDVQRDLELGLNVLEHADDLISFLEKKQVPCLRFQLDMKLYRLAIYNHQTRLSEMKALFDDALPLVADYTRRTLDMDYYFMFFNRMAVYLQDVCDYERSLEVCKNLEASLTTLSSAASLSEYIEYQEEEFRSAQLGRILGTMVQAITFMLRDADGSGLSGQTEDVADGGLSGLAGDGAGGELSRLAGDGAGDRSVQSLYLLGVRTSDRAMDQFFVRQDLERQYQYRAQLESEAGHFTEALAWLERYYGATWKTWLFGEGRSAFGVMHLSKLAADSCLSKDSHWQELGLDIAAAISQSYLSARLSFGYPELLILLRTGRALCSDRVTAIKGLRCLGRLRKEEAKQEAGENPVTRLITLEGLLEQAQAARKWDLREKEQCAEALTAEYYHFLEGNAPEPMKNIIRPWEKHIQSEHYENCRRIY